MLRIGLHWDKHARQEWLVIQVQLTRTLGLLHHLVRFMSGLPLPRWLYLWLHDLTEPPLRRWCERHPRPPAGALYRTIYNGAPTPVRLAMIPLADLWAALTIGTRYDQ